MAATQVTWSLLYTPQASAADIADDTAQINIQGKYEGLFVWDITNKRLLRAAGSLPTSEWAVVDGSAQVIPS